MCWSLTTDPAIASGTSKAQRDIHVVRHQQNQGYGRPFEPRLLTLSPDNTTCWSRSIAMASINQRRFRDGRCRVRQEDRPADIVSGSRYLKQFPGASDPPLDRRRINLQITEWLNHQFCLGLTDAFCGFKAYRVIAGPVANYGTRYAMPLQLWVQAGGAKDEDCRICRAADLSGGRALFRRIARRRGQASGLLSGSS